MSERELILTLACPDQRGIVYEVARAIAEGGGNILDSQQFGDPDASVFFMRVHFADAAEGTLESWRQNLAPVAEAHAMRWELHDAAHRQRVLVAVSRDVRDLRIDLVVLARCMQILGPPVCHALAGRAMNIHHSFLPSFKGARPYAQAHARGVKLRMRAA